MTKPPNRAMPEAPAPIFLTDGVVRFVMDRATDMRDATTPSGTPRDDQDPETSFPGHGTRLDALINLIRGTVPEPAWLRPGLERAIRSVRFAICQENANSDRVPFRNKLKGIGELIEALTAALDDGDIIAAMDGIDARAQGGALNALKTARHALADFEPYLAGAIEAVPRGIASRKKHYPRPVEQPKLATAVFVRVCWDAIHGQPAPVTAARSQNACCELWLLARGGDRKFLAGDLNPGGYLEYLRAARQMSPAALRQYCIVLGCLARGARQALSK